MEAQPTGLWKTSFVFRKFPTNTDAGFAEPHSSVCSSGADKHTCTSASFKPTRMGLEGNTGAAVEVSVLGLPILPTLASQDFLVRAPPWAVGDRAGKGGSVFLKRPLPTVCSCSVVQ